MVKTAFPYIKYSENKFVNVKREKSPYDGDINYWSKRNSKLYDGATARTLGKQNHSGEYCGLKFLEKERVELHHIDGNHNNWNDKNLVATHSSCHHYIQMSKGRKNQRYSETVCKETRTYRFHREGRGMIASLDSTNPSLKDEGG